MIHMFLLSAARLSTRFYLKSAFALFVLLFCTLEKSVGLPIDAALSLGGIETLNASVGAYFDYLHDHEIAIVTQAFLEQSLLDAVIFALNTVSVTAQAITCTRYVLVLFVWW